MKELTVSKINIEENDFENIFLSMRDYTSNSIDSVSWDKFNYKPAVDFCIAYRLNNIYIHYRINEKYIMAKTNVNNGDVWKDSCVEFFVAPENDGVYYNFEFNCIGVILLAAGISRNNREYASDLIIQKIYTKSTLGNISFEETTGDFNWELSIIIPSECFFKHKIYNLENKIFKANFYKCGNGLKIPHYLSWNIIKTPAPDFHMPEHFGILKFN